jgi:type IV secretion system protein VirB10
MPDEFRYQEKPKVVEQPKPTEVDVQSEEETALIEKENYNVELSNKSERLRVERKASYVSLFKNDKKIDETIRYQLTDKDYSPLSQDLSTLPVDRSRTLTTDMRINAVLDDDINSQIPGVAIAIVDKPVFSPNNKYILLPVFTKIICEYQSVEQHGQTRLPMTCTRAIRPDGVSVTLTDAIVADQMGRTGLTGEVDNRTFETYAGAFIMSGISALAQSGVNPNAPAWRGNAQTTFSNNIGQVTADVIQKNISLKPVIYIKAGTRMQIRPKVDIVFKEPIPIQSKKEAQHEKISN